MRPNALILGAILKLIVLGEIPKRILHSLISPARPGRGRSLISCSPRVTNTRFSPTRGDMSATVARATKSR